MDFDVIFIPLQFIFFIDYLKQNEHKKKQNQFNEEKKGERQRVRKVRQSDF